MRTTRGLVRSVIRLITPPLPAVSRPSKSDHDLQALVDDPFLQPHELDLQAPQLLLVLLLGQHLRRHLPSLAPTALPRLRVFRRPAEPL